MVYQTNDDNYIRSKYKIPLVVHILHEYSGPSNGRYVTISSFCNYIIQNRIEELYWLQNNMAEWDEILAFYDKEECIDINMERLESYCNRDIILIIKFRESIPI